MVLEQRGISLWYNKGVYSPRNHYSLYLRCISSLVQIIISLLILLPCPYEVRVPQNFLRGRRSRYAWHSQLNRIEYLASNQAVRGSSPLGCSWRLLRAYTLVRVLYGLAQPVKLTKSATLLLAAHHHILSHLKPYTLILNL